MWELRPEATHELATFDASDSFFPPPTPQAEFIELQHARETFMQEATHDLYAEEVRHSADLSMNKGFACETWDVG